MPSIVALLLAFGCTAAFWSHERRRHPLGSRALWIVVFWTMRSASRGLEAWVRGNGLLADQLFLLVVAVAGFVVLSQRWGRASAVLQRNGPLLLFYGYITISICWSPAIGDSAKQLFRAFGDLTMALIVLTEPDPFGALIGVFRRAVQFLIPVSVVLVKYYPDLGRMREKHWAPDSWVGVANHKNSLGQLCLLAGVVLAVGFFRLARERRLRLFQLPAAAPWDCVLGLMTLFLLNAGGHERSSTSIVALAGAVGLLFLAERRRDRPRGLPSFMIKLACVGAVLNTLMNLLLGSSLVSFIMSSQGKDATLTGRTELWADILDFFHRPLLGFGYMGFWSPDVKAYFKAIPRDSWGPGQAHNGYLETYIQLGVVGLVLLALLILHGFRRAARTLPVNFDYGVFRIILLLTVLLQNTTEAGFPRPTNLVWTTFLFIAIDPAHQWVRAATSRRRTARAPASLHAAQSASA